MELLLSRPATRRLSIPAFYPQRHNPVARRVAVAIPRAEASRTPAAAAAASISFSRNVPVASPESPAPLPASTTTVSLVSTPSMFISEFYKLSMADQFFIVLGVLSCLTVGALLTALMAAIPTLKAIYRASVSLEKLSNMAREELPGTMAAIRLSSMEISDLTLELNDLSQEISDGVRSSARAVQAAEVGIRRMGAVAATQAFAMLQERAIVPVEAVKPVVANAAETTRQAMIQAQRAVLTLASHPQLSRWFWRNVKEQEQEQEQEEQEEEQP